MRNMMLHHGSDGGWACFCTSTSILAFYLMYLTMATAKRSGETHDSFVCSSPYVISHSYHIFLRSFPLPASLSLSFKLHDHFRCHCCCSTTHSLIHSVVHCFQAGQQKRNIDLTNVQSMQNAFFQMAREIMMGNTLDVTIHITQA